MRFLHWSRHSTEHEKLYVPRRELEQRKLREFSQKSFGITYIDRSVALEGAFVDFHDGTTVGKNSATLEVVYVPAGTWRKFRKFL
jgi:hypothetical protein